MTAQPQGEPNISAEVTAAADSWRHQHILDIDDFTVEEIELVFQTTQAMKEVLSRPIRKVPALRGKTIVILFFEPSTRTRLSFEIAAKNLSADVSNLAASASSAAKGESLVDTVDTLRALGADIVIMRHPNSGAPATVARHVKASIVNAGDGWHAHPSQALVDVFTLHEHRPGLKGLRAVIIGDIMHSRVAHSNIWGLTTMGVNVTLCGPTTLLPDGLSSRVPGRGAVEVETNLERALAGADMVMPLRLQLERQASGLLPSIREYVQLYQLNEERLALARPDVLVFHPGPVNEGIETVPTVARGPHSVISQQVTNGVALRMALLYLISGGPKQ